MAAALKNVTRRSGLTQPGIVLKSTRLSRDADAQKRQLLMQQAAAFSYLQDVRGRVAGLSFSPDAAELLLSGIRTIYKRARKRVPLKATDDKTEALHEWRKDVKAFWHVLEVLPARALPRTRQMVQDARRLAGVLGEDHDLALLAARLTKDVDSRAGKAQRAVVSFPVKATVHN